MAHVDIYTDGACSGNPGPGGWAAILRFQERELELSGSAPLTTNNRMEITAAVEALAALRYPCEVTLYSDSKYLVDAINLGWAVRWQRNGWKRNAKEPALNTDIWSRLLDLCGRHKVTFVWVKGHADNPYNNRCDRLAVEKYKELQEEKGI